jgi:hypothetical protein
MREYRFITDVDELGLDCGNCYELFPGKERNNNSVFWSEYSMEVVEDIFAMLDEHYDHYTSADYDEEKKKLLIEELVKRKNEIQETGSIKLTEEIMAFYSESGYNELVKKICEKKDEVLKMLEGMIDWLKAVKEKELRFVAL